MRFRVIGKADGGIEGRNKKGIKCMILYPIDVFSILDQQFVHYISYGPSRIELKAKLEYFESSHKSARPIATLIRLESLRA
jgi:hypothetical protein